MSKTLLIASAGGHVDELMFHARRIGIDDRDAVWVTSPTAQTESLLKGQNVIWVPRIGSAEIAKAVRRLPAAFKLYRRVKPDLIVSTGALFTTPYLLAASLMGCEIRFIDSVTRVAGPSKTGRFVQRFTRAKLFAQGDGWGDPSWELVPSVFDAFESVESPDHGQPVFDTATVSLGTEIWPFPRAIDRIRALLPEARITWQVGHTEYREGEQLLRQWVPADELRTFIRESDLVVMHAGVGSVLVALDEGRVPVILPRREHQGEMVDDHQTEVASMLAARGLVISVDPDELEYAHLVRAAGLRARRRGDSEVRAE